jgi:hypothetical protein
MPNAKHCGLTQAQALNLLNYNPDTGIFIWANPNYRSNRHPGMVAGSVNAEGCNTIGIRVGEVDHRIKAHRLVWLMHYGHWPLHDVDHIDGDRNNNKISNLRQATPRQNTFNVGIRTTNNSGYRGVSWHRPLSKWRAQIHTDGRGQHLGYYDTPQEASAAYEQAARRVHGGFYRTQPRETA